MTAAEVSATDRLMICRDLDADPACVVSALPGGAYEIAARQPPMPRRADSQYS